MAADLKPDALKTAMGRTTEICSYHSACELCTMSPLLLLSLYGTATKYLLLSLGSYLNYIVYYL